MELGGNLIRTKFDDIDEKVDFMIELCQELQAENQELKIRIKALEEKLESSIRKEKNFLDQESLVHSKIDGLLKKLDSFSADSGS